MVPKCALWVVKTIRESICRLALEGIDRKRPHGSPSRVIERAPRGKIAILLMGGTHSTAFGFSGRIGSIAGARAGEEGKARVDGGYRLVASAESLRRAGRRVSVRWQCGFVDVRSLRRSKAAHIRKL